MSFPNRLTLSHLIDDENDKDMMSKEHRADCSRHRDIDTSLLNSAAVSNDTGEHDKIH